MNRETVPDENTQAETYRTIVEAMGGDPVAIRVLDWGGEKDIEALASAGIVPDVADANPALGLRGISLLLRQDELLETQFAAILRAAAGRTGAGDAADGHDGRPKSAPRARSMNAWHAGFAAAASGSPRNYRRSAS